MRCGCYERLGIDHRCKDSRGLLLGQSRSKMAASMTPQKRQCVEQDEEARNKQSFTPREYQVELLELAKDHNTIACLGTGTGKTFIAVMLIRELSDSVRVPFEKGGKKIIFLVPTVPLVTQQSKVIEQHTDLRVHGYCGEMEVDSWNASKWREEFKSYEVLVMTAEICRIILHHAFLSLTQIRLIVFDECHRAQGNHPYREIMKCFENCPKSEMPRIFGLSASLLNQKCNPRNLERKINDLEKTLRSTVETASDLQNLQKYGTDPKEYLLFYGAYVSPSQRDLTVVLKEALKQITNMTYVDEVQKMKDDGADIVYFKIPKKSLQQVINIYNDLGVWCANLAADVYIKEVDCILRRLKYLENEAILKCARKALVEFQTKCLESGDCVSHIRRLDTLSPKLQRFIEVFRQIKINSHVLADGANLQGSRSSNQRDNLNFCGIVFVEQRIVSYILTHFILEAKRYYPELEFLLPGFVVGHGTYRSSGCVETSMNVKKQKEIIESFREKTLNLLIATSVIEEGMDIPKCNVVMRFDLPKDFRSYIQSKGRARSQNALYILLASLEDQEVVLYNLSNYFTIEAMLKKRCHNRKMPSDEAIEEYMDDDLLPPYMPSRAVGQPRISFTSAISVVNRYCSKLPSDMATKLTPKFKIQVVDEECTRKEYICTLRLPINSCLKQDIVGATMPRRRAAKMAAALKACQLLDECGELDDHFVPYSHHVDEAIDELLGDLAKGVEKSVPGQPQPGTKARRQIYDKGIAEVFKDNLPVPGEPCYLYVFEMDLIVPLPKEQNPKGRPIVNPADSSLGIGILSKRKIPPICKFPIFTRSGVVGVSAKLAVAGMICCQEDLKELAAFHRFIFSDALALEDEKKFFSPENAEFSLYIVPVNRGNGSSQYHIDWNFISYTKHHDYNVEKLRPKEKFKHVEYEESLFLDSVVTRAYKIDWNNEPPVFHYVKKIVYELTPDSMIEDSRKKNCISFKDYYKSKYDLTPMFKNQPLLDTERIASTTLWKPSHKQKKELDVDSSNLSKSKRRLIDYREYLVPEFCVIHPFPSAFFRKVTYIPTILFRLNSLLLAEQLRQLVAVSADFGTVNLPEDYEWPFFDLEAHDKILNKSGNFQQFIGRAFQNPSDIIKSCNSEITSFEAQPDLRSHPGPNPASILQALTSKSAGDVFHLERLETIGDSFLKYAMSVKIYVTYPNFDEGKLTRLRIGLVRNLYLYSSAAKKSLQRYMTCEPFIAHMSWLPPCYVVNSEDEAGVAKKRAEISSENVVYLLRKQLISDKSIADSVEALIGVYLLSCGPLGALNFMHWLGLNAFAVDVGAILSNWPPIPKPPLLVDDKPNILAHLMSGMDRFEEIIKYRFNDKAYLLQAFTHPSYNDNEITDCYQRLEFLGDSVLDYLITRKLYEDPKQHSPGELTDLRSALVNNAYFASLAIKHQYHRFLKIKSPTLFQLIGQYIELLESTEAFEMFKKHGYYLEEIECFVIEEVEVPKALGDVFESVAGAIYLDSGMSLDTLWNVYYPMIKPAMDHMSEHVPKSPVRVLYETVPSVRFGKPIIEENGRIRLEIKLPDGKIVSGIGPNKHVAKLSCAKRAISYLKQSMS